MKSEINLRPATIEDIEILHYWDTKPHVQASTGQDENIDWTHELTNAADWQEILIAELGNEPIGVLQIMDPHLEVTHYWGEIEPNHRAIDIWIGEEDNLSKGYGTDMMRKGIIRCFKDLDVSAIVIDPLVTNERAIKFYEKLGFNIIEQRMFGEDNCYVMRLNRIDWEMGQGSNIGEG